MISSIVCGFSNAHYTYFDGFVAVSIFRSCNSIAKYELVCRKLLNSPASTVIAYKLGKQSEVSSFIVLFLAISFSLAYVLQLCLC